MNKTTTKILFSLAAIIFLIMTGYNLIFVASQMSDENWYTNQPEGVIINEVIPGGASDNAGLMEGDRLVMVNGDSITSHVHAQSYLDSAEPGASLIYTIEREGKIFDIKVNLALAGLRFWVFALVLTGLLFLIYSLFIAFVKYDNDWARLHAFAMLLFSLLLMNMKQAAYIGQQSTIYQIVILLLIVFNFLAIAVFAHASLYYPEKKYKQINRLWMIYIHYIIAGIMIILSFVIALIINFFFNYLFIIPLIYILIIELINWRKRRKEYLARIKVFKITIALIFIPLILVGIFPGMNQSSIGFLAFLSCLLPITYFYTTIRYRVYDIYIRIRLSLVYTVIQTLIISTFILSLFLVVIFLPQWDFNLPAIYITGSSFEIRNTAQLEPEIQNQIHRGYLLFFGITLAIILYLFKNRIQKFMDRLFFQQKYDYRVALKNFGELLSTYLSRNQIGQHSVEQIHEFMKVKGTLLAISNNGQFDITGTKGNLSQISSSTFTLDSTFITGLIKNKRQLKQSDMESFPITKELRKLIYCGTPVISAKNNLEAILLTAEKLSESAYNNDDLELLNLFAENLGIALERARLYEEMAVKERLERELEIARDIQLNSLPKCDPDYSGLQICSALAPANEVGGDYYDYLEIDDHRLGIIIGDVVGKGTSGAIHMSKIQGFLYTLKLEHLPPIEMFSKLNTLIWDHFESEFFFTALYGHFDTEKRTVEIFRMGHNGLVYYNAETKNIKVIEPGGIAFGMTETEKFKSELESIRVSYAKNDILVFLTDGFYEAMDKNKQQYGEENICKLISSNPDDDAAALMDRLHREIKKYTSGIQRDDTTGIVIKILQ